MVLALGSGAGGDGVGGVLGVSGGWVRPKAAGRWFGTKGDEVMVGVVALVGLSWWGRQGC
jgi:hypothetical protein